MKGVITQPGGLHLLSERTTHKKIDGKPHLVYKGFSQSRKRNEALIERVRPWGKFSGLWRD